MLYNLKKASGVCMESLRYGCAELERMEGRNVSCMRCLVVSEFMHDPCNIKFDQKAHESVEEWVSFLIRVNAVSTNRRD